MTLPTSRNYTQNPAAPIQSSLLNALQDCVVGMKRPSGWRWITPSTPNVPGTVTMQEDNLLYANASTFSGMQLGHWLEGDRITAFAVRHLGTGVAWTAMYVLKMNKGDGATTTLGTLSIVNPAAAWATFTLTLGAAQVLPANASLLLSETTGAIVSNRLGLVGIQSDRL